MEPRETSFGASHRKVGRWERGEHIPSEAAGSRGQLVPQEATFGAVYSSLAFAAVSERGRSHHLQSWGASAEVSHPSQAEQSVKFALKAKHSTSQRKPKDPKTKRNRWALAHRRCDITSPGFWIACSFEMSSPRILGSDMSPRVGRRATC